MPKVEALAVQAAVNSTELKVLQRGMDELKQMLKEHAQELKNMRSELLDSLEKHALDVDNIRKKQLEQDSLIDRILWKVGAVSAAVGAAAGWVAMKIGKYFGIAF